MFIIEQQLYSVEQQWLVLYLSPSSPLLEERGQKQKKKIKGNGRKTKKNKYYNHTLNVLLLKKDTYDEVKNKMEEHKESLFKGAKGNLFEFSRELRKRSTEAEEILWQFLRNKNHNGLKFRRQHPLKDYIADFYCHELKLVI